MTLREIAHSVNDYIEINSTTLKDFQKIRATAKGIRPPGKTLFDDRNIKDENDFVFHYGGRKEMQYNIGIDEDQGVAVFRYGLAFSLESSPSFHNPQIDLKNSIDRYNKYIKANKEKYQDLKIWLWDENFRSEFFPIAEIPDNWVKRKNFIFIGSYLEKNIQDIGGSDIKTIVELFERMFKIYKHVEL